VKFCLDSPCATPSFSSTYDVTLVRLSTAERLVVCCCSVGSGAASTPDPELRTKADFHPPCFPSAYRWFLHVSAFKGEWTATISRLAKFGQNGRDGRENTKTVKVKLLVF
jgi:hypothetical protein